MGHDGHDASLFSLSEQWSRTCSIGQIPWYRGIIVALTSAAQAASTRASVSTMLSTMVIGEPASISSLTSSYLRAEFGGLRVRREQRREALGIAARHAAFRGHAVDPGMAPRGGKARGVARHVVAVN